MPNTITVQQYNLQNPEVTHLYLVGGTQTVLIHSTDEDGEDGYNHDTEFQVAIRKTITACGMTCEFNSNEIDFKGDLNAFEKALENNTL